MDDIERGKVLAALQSARALIEARGYQPEWCKSTDSPLNLSNALTLACEDYTTYVLARQSFSKNWGGPESGLLFWETYRRHSTTDALGLIDKVIFGVRGKVINPTYKPKLKAQRAL